MFLFTLTRRFEQWADECGVRHLRQCFGETKELVRALLHPDLAAVADSPSLRRQLFPRMDPQVHDALSVSKMLK